MQLNNKNNIFRIITKNNIKQLPQLNPIFSSFLKIIPILITSSFHQVYYFPFPLVLIVQFFTLHKVKYNLQKVNMQDKSTDMNPSFKKIAEQFKRRLQFHNIFKEVSLVSKMTPNMQLDIRSLHNMDILKVVTDQQIKQMIRRLSFLSIRQVNDVKQKKSMVRFQYKLSPTLLIVTGIYEQSLTKLLYTYNNLQKKKHHGDINKAHLAPKTTNNGFYTLIEACSKENAENLKGFLRSRKKQLEDSIESHFKVENRRIRIFSAGEEDTFTFIIEMMSEYKAQRFYRSMDEDLTYRNRPVPPIPGIVTYRMFSAVRIPNNQEKPTRLNQAQNRRNVENQQRKMIAKQNSKKEEDESSDSTCITSENIDKFQDVVDEDAFKSNEIFILEAMEGKQE